MNDLSLYLKKPEKEKKIVNKPRRTKEKSKDCISDNIEK